MSVQLLVDIFVGGVKQTAGSTISIDNATEAELVQNKKAVWVVAPSQSNGVPVTATTDPVTGGISLSAGGKSIETGSKNDARPAIASGTRMFQRENSISVGTNAGNGRLVDTEFTVRGSFNGGRFLFANYSTGGTQTINAARVAVSGTHLNNGNTLTWSNIKFSGSDTGTIPAATTGVGGEVIPGYLLSDFVSIDSIARADGGTRPIVRVRTHVPDSSLVMNAPTLANIQAIQAAAYNQGFQFGGNVTSALVGAINTASLSPSEGGGVAQPVDAMMNFTESSYSLAAFGDSLTEGATTTGSGSGWPVQLGCQAIAAGVKLSCETYGNSGWTHEDYIAHARAYITAGARPSFLATLPYSVNSGGSADTSYGAAWARLLSLLELCRANNICPVVLTHPPAQGSVIASIQAQNAKVMALPNWVIKVDAYSVLDSGSGTLKPEYNPGDGVHWNDAGHAAVAAEVLAQLRANGLS